MRMKRAEPKTPTLTMKYAGGLIKHLGLQMYSGAVPSIAELIKNAYDANATKVEIAIPFDESWAPSSFIKVKDNGNGMSFADCDSKYLVVGRDRRKEEGDRVEGNPNRRPIGRKGIGKLAGFGIADVIVIRSVKDGKRSQFEMNYEDIERLNLGEPYNPRVIEADVKTNEPSGTTVTLKAIKLQRVLNEDEFRYSMAKRFALLSGGFSIVVNGRPLQRDEISLQFRFPEVSAERPSQRFNQDGVPGCGTVKWWIGFTELPITRDEDRGIVVMVRDTIAQQTPFFFGLTGGFEGQLGLQYITGEVYADSLDRDAIDAIATDRGSINWEKEEARPLLDWGKTKIKDLLKEWNKKRREVQEERLERHTKYMEKIRRFPDRQRDELTKAITKLASIATIEDERLDELVAFLIEAYERADVMAVIRQLMAASPVERAQVFEILSEWDVVEAVSFAQIVKGRLAVIDKFEELLRSGAPEKVTDREDMQGFLAKHPWLIDASLTLMDHEKSLDTMLVKHFNLDPTGKTEGAKRIDFFCLRDPNNIVVVEVKGADVPAGKGEVRQLIDYVEFFEEQQKSQSTDPSRPRKHVTGHLIAKHLTDDGQKEASHALARGVMFRPWDNLAEAARQSNREFYEVAKKRTEPGDPRIEALEEESQEEK
jgi:hypothetical protein